MLLQAMVNTLSHWALVMGCMLLLTETSLVSSSVLVGSMLLLAWTVAFVVIVPTFEGGVALAEVGAVER